MKETTMLYNYHNHTSRCHHATGEVREYIEAAISGGVKYFGFSEHIPFVFPENYEPWSKLQSSEVSDYFNEINALREEFKDKIDISIGYEMEYYPKFFEEMYKSAKKAGAEYLILGQHFLGGEGIYGINAFIATEDKSVLCEYADTIVEAMKTGVFTYVAHPDVLTYLGDEKDYREEMRKVCVASRETGVPVEINLNGIYFGRSYPKEEFWELAGEEKCPVVIGCDAHEPKRACDMVSFKTAMEMVKKYKLNLLEKPELVSLK